MNIPEIEFQSADEITRCQEKKLAESVQYLNTNSMFYRNMFIKEHINPDDIKTIQDLKRIPLVHPYVAVL